ncbi:MAG: peptidylprolyl isomerase [Verrucomicrobiales bacterium]
MKIPHSIRLIVCASQLASLSLIAQENGKETIASVGEASVSLEEVRAKVAALTDVEKESLRRDPGALGQFVRSVLTQQLLLREAKAVGWEKQAVVTERLEKLRETIVTSTFLESKSQTAAGYPGEAELQAAYESNKAALRVTKSYRLAQVFIADPKAAPAGGAKEKLAKVQASLAAKDADFSAIATANSEEAGSAARGGEIGWLTEEQIQPGIRDVLPKLALGQVSEAIRLDGGWHILKLLDSREPYTPTLDQIRPQLSARLKAERERMLAQEYLAKLLQDNPIAINEMILSKVLPAAPPAK